MRLLLGLLLCVSLSASAQDWLWAQSYGGERWDLGTAVAATPGGGTIVSGTFTDTLRIGGETYINENEADAFVAKLDADGTVLWSLRTSGRKQPNVQTVLVDEGGEIYLAGRFMGNTRFGDILVESAGNSDAFVVKLSPGGEVVWARGYGGKMAEAGTALALGDNGHLFLAGGFNTEGSIGPFAYEVGAGSAGGYIATLEAADGEVLDAVGLTVDDALGGGGGVSHLIPDGEGGVYAAGSFHFSLVLGSTTFRSQSETQRNSFIARLAADGTLRWTRVLTSDEQVVPLALDVDASGNLLALGYFWARDGSATATLDPLSVDGTAPSNTFLARLSPNGEPAWIRTVGEGRHLWAEDLRADPEGGAYVTGRFLGETTFGVTDLTSAGGYDAFAGYLRADGEPEWAVPIGGPSDDAFGGLSIDASGGLVVSGSFRETVIVGSTTLESAGNVDMLFARLGSVVVAAEPPPAVRSLVLSAPRPHPARGGVEMTLRVDRLQPVRVVLVDALGRDVQVLFEGIPASTRTLQIDTADLAPGRYAVRAVSPLGDTSQPLVVTR
ncbi:MAG: hypothetical protein AAGI52_08275 [Bacteroidota bacterium]